ncbi:MAG: M20/M25/M40 family metallo-hydrolase, partial [Actinomycetota bacterium]
MAFDAEHADSMIARAWADELIPQLEEYITIPALSPAFDPDWAANGHIGQATDQIENWIRSRPVEGMTVWRQEIEGRTPLVVARIDAFGPDADTAADAPTTVLYGHLDKQPEMTGWRDDLGPWTPVREGDRLYGRGGADDGYAAFASLAAIEAVQASGGNHPPLVVLIEASEESGSPDLPAHIETLLADPAAGLGQVDLVVCLDSGCATYDTVWLTTSLRGLVGGTLQIDIVTEGLHSGSAGGVIPSTFRIMRSLLDRVEEAGDGSITLASANVDIPEYRYDEAKATAEMLGNGVLESPPLIAGATTMVETPLDALLARTWKPSLSYTGLDGMPPT